LTSRRAMFATLFLLVAATSLRAQNPPAFPPPASVAPPTESSTKKNSKPPHPCASFLIHGTVFDQQALSLPEAELRVRRNGEKKFHWNTYSNSRGEFAVCVPPGSEYELAVQARGFNSATRVVDAKNGLSEENVVFRMELVTEKKK
jgi:hypothetical protein